MTRKIILLGMLGVLILLAGCGDDLDDKYGKPYKINPTEEVKKVEIYTRLAGPVKSSLSLTVELDKVLLKESIDWHKDNSPYGESYQTYNYVINEKEMIIVARWIEQPTPQPVNINTIANACKTTGTDNAKKELTNTAQFMVNFYPGDPQNKELSVLLCGGRENILDELTKHFMLAQGLGVKSSDYDESWRGSSVRYAGEILIDVAKCVYTINNGSGTYRPYAGVDKQDKEDNKYIKNVVTLFNNEVGSDPAYHPRDRTLKYNDSGKGVLPTTVCTPSTTP